VPENKFRPIPPLSQKDIDRFWSKVDKRPGQGPKGECWCWTAGRTHKGMKYGKFSATHRITVTSHRVSYFLATGVDPVGWLVCHDCDNPPCCRGEHLHLGTTLTNAQEATQRGLLKSGDLNPSRMYPERLAHGAANGSRLYPERLRRGAEHPHASLTEDAVLCIRSRYADGSISYSQLAREFNTSKAHISRLILRKSWAHI